MAEEKVEIGKGAILTDEQLDKQAHPVDNTENELFNRGRDTRIPLGMNTDAAARILKTYITHTDGRPVYAFRDLPPELVAALFARYSRTHKPIAQVFLELMHDLGININESKFKWLEEMRSKLVHAEKTRTFHEKYTINFGHESIRYMAAGIPVAIDACSLLAGHFIASHRLDLSVVERSTRYQKKFFDPSRYVRGRNLFGEDAPAELVQSYDALMRIGLNTAGQVYTHLLDAFREKFPYDSDKHKDDGITKTVWNKWLKNRALDNARYTVPVGAITGMGMVANVSTYNRLILKLLNHPSTEMKMLGQQIYQAVSTVAPVLTKEPHFEPLVAKSLRFPDRDFAAMRNSIVESVHPDSRSRLGEPETYGDAFHINVDEKHMGDTDLLMMLAALVIGQHVNLPTDVVYQWIGITFTGPDAKPPKKFLKMSEFEGPANSVESFCRFVLAKFTGLYSADGKISALRAPRVKRLPNGMVETIGHEKLPRVFEMVNLSFDMVMDFGAWRDLARHQLVSRIDYPLTPGLGYAVPADAAGLPEALQHMFGECYQMSVRLWEAIANEPTLGPDMAQYAAMNNWNQRRIMRANLRELDYIIGLRTRWTGHFSYRRASQMLLYRIGELWPSLKGMLVGDMNDYAFGKAICIPRPVADA